MRNSFAIDISDQSIKYGELILSYKGLDLGHFGKEKIPAGAVVSGKIENEDELVSVLKKIKQKENFHFVRVSFPEEQMYLFNLNLPKTNKNELRDMILLQIEEHIPLKAIDTIFDYDIISSSEDTVSVEVSAIASSTVESYLSCFRKAGITVLSFELEAQAIARTVVPTEDREPIMIVDFGDTRTGVSIVHDGRVIFTTTISMGGLDLTNIISKNFSISVEKAEEMKRSYGLDGISNIEDIFPVILNDLSVLRDELNKQLDYWKNHDNLGVKHDNINRIILCGGDSNLTGLREYLESSMKIKVVDANAWVNISNMNTSIPEMSFKESLSYVTVLGLALGDFCFTNRKIINVLPEEEKKILNKDYWKRLISTFLLLVTTVTIAFVLLLSPSYFYTVLKQKIVEDKLDNFNLNNKNLTDKDINQSILAINDKLSLFSLNDSKYSVYNDIIGLIMKDKPEGITFSQILFNKRKDKSLFVEIHGNAINRSALRNFKTIIDNDPKIASSDLPISDFLEKNDINFMISILFK